MLFMRYNRDRAHRRLFFAAASSVAPCEIRSSRLAGLSSHPTSEHIIQTGYDQADPGCLHTIRRNQRIVSPWAVREAAEYWRRQSGPGFGGREATDAFCGGQVLVWP